jgi:hypothetical protein
MGALIHLRRDIAESKISFPIIMNADMLSYGSTEKAYEVATYASKLALIGKVGGVISQSGKCKLPKNASAVLYDDKKSVPSNCKKNTYDAFDDSAFASIVKNENLGAGKVDLDADTFLSSTGEIYLDAKNGSWEFMHGVACVIEYLAYQVSEEYGEKFSEEFFKNMEKSIDKAKR